MIKIWSRFALTSSIWAEEALSLGRWWQTVNSSLLLSDDGSWSGTKTMDQRTVDSWQLTVDSVNMMVPTAFWFHPKSQHCHERSGYRPTSTKAPLSRTDESEHSGSVWSEEKPRKRWHVGDRWKTLATESVTGGWMNSHGSSVPWIYSRSTVDLE